MFEISVILPVYKPGKYLLDCFNSLDKQTLTRERFCVYIGLNGPKDDYENMIFHYLAEVKFNYKYFYIPTSGVSNARNHLLDASDSQFLVFLDDDDLISPSYLEELMKVTDSATMGLANIINFKDSLSDSFENYIGRSFVKLPPTGRSKPLYRKYFSSPCAKMLHRDMVKDVRFDTQLARGEDGLFMTTISKNIATFAKCNSDAIYYVNHRQNSASRSTVNRLLEIKRVIYLTGKYSKLLFSPGYSFVFIITRILATIRHLKKLF
ncbi:glycosyltransferase family A protein [Vibrio navarrensis]|uniref:Glycosyltransferase 2-like domain-containing protein n=1 Tax=Vibrio navarrensis TaxID=29495 RepID=A0A099LR86_9VIBR|nr:glycosyltransferase family 2 protein [Vibrio navarrensis]KGK10169.1 hypothetical protein EA26_02100 [Vibrio navarrensis]MBE4590559.1 hypothetical protein [Vibrio navarrensis]MBE4616474.1 hypothetical protein [Vibrio navarrensis]QOD69853.1 glycosyltransferase family 2 protein [Vibrio navarrensis]